METPDRQAQLGCCPKRKPGKSSAGLDRAQRLRPDHSSSDSAPEIAYIGQRRLRSAFSLYNLARRPQAVLAPCAAGSRMSISQQREPSAIRLGMACGLILQNPDSAQPPIL